MDQKFLNIIKSSKPVLVDFYADWCMPCREIPPILREVKEDIRGGIRIIKVNVDDKPEIASRFNVNSLPTLMVFKNGRPCWTRVGICKAEEVKSVLQNQFKTD